MSIFRLGYGCFMPPHRDWTRHGVGRALLWWPFAAFVTVAAFPGLAVPGVIVTGVLLVVVGLVGGAVGRRVRSRRRARIRREVTPFAPRAVREARAALAQTVPSPREPRSPARTPVQAGVADADAEDDLRADRRSRVA